MGDFSKELGAQMPLGYWDPLKLMADADQETFDLFREIETKHGRVAMLAVLGHITTTAGFRLPGEIAFGVPFSSCKTGLAGLSTIPFGGLVQLVMFIGLIEFGYSYRKEEIERENARPTHSFSQIRFQHELTKPKTGKIPVNAYGWSGCASFVKADIRQSGVRSGERAH